MFFLSTGTRTSDMLRLVSIFADRLCHVGPVASGRSIRRFSRFSTIVCAALIPSHQGEALDVSTLMQLLECFASFPKLYW